MSLPLGLPKDLNCLYFLASALRESCQKHQFLSVSNIIQVHSSCKKRTENDNYIEIVKYDKIINLNSNKKIIKHKKDRNTVKKERKEIMMIKYCKI